LAIYNAYHPFSQLVTQSWLEGCERSGYICEVSSIGETTPEAAIAQLDQVLSRDDIKGVQVWLGGNPAVLPFLKKAQDKGIPIVMPHFPADQSFYKGLDNVVQIAADIAKYPDPVAKAMCDELARLGKTEGSIGLTESSHNVTEDSVAKVFAEGIKKYCPQFKVLDVQLEGLEPTGAIAVATAVIQANPDIVGALSTTGGGATTWAGAQQETGVKIPAIGMDYTRVNLDLLKDGKIFGLVAQPVYDESADAADLLYKMANGEKVPFWTVLDAPLITQANVNDYYGMLDRLEPRFAPTPTPKP